jgi:hypothetical protein
VGLGLEERDQLLQRYGTKHSRQLAGFTHEQEPSRETEAMGPDVELRADEVAFLRSRSRPVA